MKTVFAALVGLACAAAATSAAAQSSISARNGVVTTTRTQVNGKQIDRITCREFLRLREEIKPHAISYVVGYDKATKRDDAVIDMITLARLVPVVEKTCKTTPQLSLLQRIRADLHRL
jgi:acid stress chaperone HdeA